MRRDGARLTQEARDRLVLSLSAEPDDRGLRELVAVDGIAHTARACRRSGRADDTRLGEVLAAAESCGARWIIPGSAEWPPALDDLAGHDPPAAPWGLWVRGHPALGTAVGRAVAIVGARTCTTYGAEVAGDLGADLADRSWTVVSGAAFGIDACAHRGALAVGGRTVAVLAGGVDVPYPRAHASLLDRVADEGWIVSEHPPGEAPRPHRFLSRNRLIAALAAGTVVVEAADRSGSLNTLHWADRLGRVTMAVPGPVVSRQSDGTHRAMREGAAVLVTGADDVEDELRGVGWEGLPADAPVPRPALGLLDHLAPASPRSTVAVALAAELSAREVRAALSLLERRGRVRRSGDGWVRADGA